VARIEHGTLAADEVTSVTLIENTVGVEVLNRDGVAEIFFTIDGSTPTVEGDDCHCLPAAIGALIVNSPKTVDVVKLISTGTPKYTVSGVR
jgi:hypothetical protein